MDQGVSTDSSVTISALLTILICSGIHTLYLKAMCALGTSTGSPAPLLAMMVLINARSIGNKSFILNDLFCSESVDFIFLTETWQQNMVGLLDYGKNHNHDYFGQY